MADANTAEGILCATRQLLEEMVRRNGIDVEQVVSIIFSTTRDLNAEFPALAARQLGWQDVPLLCTTEIDVPGSLPRCIRILIHWNTSKALHEVVHVYLKGAAQLRPDLAAPPAQGLGKSPSSG